MNGEMRHEDLYNRPASEKPLRVLLADDSTRTRNGLRALLSTIRSTTVANEVQLTFEIIGEASNGREAVDLVAKYLPDAVLLDAQMPDMNGLEATRIIKNSWPKVRVVILTIHSQFESEALMAGADKFLVKGCPTAELLDAFEAEKID